MGSPGDRVCFCRAWDWDSSEAALRVGMGEAGPEHPLGQGITSLGWGITSLRGSHPGTGDHIPQGITSLWRSHPSKRFCFPPPLSDSVTISAVGSSLFALTQSSSGQVFTAVQILPDLSKSHHDLPSKETLQPCVYRHKFILANISVVQLNNCIS